MFIASTYQDGQIFQHFGHTQQFKVYEIEDGKVISSKVVDNGGNGHEALTVYLKNIDDFPKVNRVYAELFEEPFPARSCIAAAALPKDVGIMVSAIGVKY